MPESPRVSVVIPAFNQAGLLQLAIRSVQAQTMSDLEIIVVDDGSTDGTRELCASIGEPRLRYIHQRNDGTKGVGARNHAMLCARGDWIALLDQDDLWWPDKLARQLDLAAATPGAGSVFCRARFIDGDGQVTGDQPGDLPQGDVFHAMLESNRYYAVSGIFRRDLLPVIGLPHAWVGLADYALWLTLARQAPVAVVDEVLADYRIHAQGYQAAQRRSAMLRLADDAWQIAMVQRPLMHPGCPACERAHARSRRAAANAYLRALRAVWSGGRYAGSRLAWRRSWSTAPGWLLRPWVLLPQALRLAAAALRGLFAPRT